VLSLLNSSRPLFSSYLRIRSSAPSANSPELIESRAELESVIRDLTADLADLIESVKAVESDPYSYGIDIEEVQRRRALVGEVGNEVGEMREELSKTVQQAQAKGKNVMNGDSMLPDPDTFDDEDVYAEFEQQRQHELLHEQDEALDGVFRTVGTLRQQAAVMGHELEEHGQLLDDVDVVADRVGDKLQTGIKKIGWVIKQNEGSPYNISGWQGRQGLIF
jgi:member of the syntaxin family of t-SNAREs